MPLRAALFLGAKPVTGIPLVVLFVLHGADGADLRVVASELAFRVQERVNVEARCLWSPGEFAEAEDELLLEVVCEVVLCAEKDNAPLRNLAG